MKYRPCERGSEQNLSNNKSDDKNNEFQPINGSRRGVYKITKINTNTNLKYKMKVRKRDTEREGGREGGRPQ